MCVFSVKYFTDQGWVAGKCRDRSYKPEIHINQSFRNKVERCLLWDDDTKWTEGVNEFGIAILNTTFRVKKDEKENTFRDNNKSFYSPGGKNIRNALYKKTTKDVLDSLIESEMEGFSVVFSKEEAYILEAPLYVGKDTEYEYKVVKLDKSKTYVRTNHGIIFPEAGYPKNSDDDKLIAGRKSSESRYEIVHEAMSEVKDPMDMFRVLSLTPKSDSQLNPFRVSESHGKHIMVTTGQILIIPSEKTLYYRPVWCSLNFNFQKLNNPETKTFFEVVSSRKLLSNKIAKEIIQIAKLIMSVF